MKKIFLLTALINIMHVLNGYADVKLEMLTPLEGVKILKLNEKQILHNEEGYILYGTLVLEDDTEAMVAFTLLQETSRGHKMTFDYAPEPLIYNKFTKIKPNFGYHFVLKALRS